MTRGPLHTVLAGSLRSDQALDAMNDVVRAFLDEHLRRTPVGFPDAQLEAHSGELELHDVAPIREWWNAKSASQQAEARRALDEALDNGVPVDLTRTP